MRGRLAAGAAGRAEGPRGATGLDKTGSGCRESAAPGGTRPASFCRGLRAIEPPEERPELVAWLHGVYPNSDDGIQRGRGRSVAVGMSLFSG